MMNIEELFTLEELEQEVKDKTVNIQSHPTLPLFIANYSDLATYQRRWNEVTLNCRGLIYDNDYNIVARGPRKFWNYSEPNAPDFPLDTQVSVTSKEDGSLGIYWEYEGHKGIATRGSFVSEQAIRGTHMLTGDELPGEIFEVVYGQNRIVLDYAGQEALLPLGSVDLVNGLISRDGIQTTLGDVISWDIPEGQEGYVVDILDDRLQTVAHVKLKGEWYVRMHSAIFGLTEKKVWESCVDGSWKEFIASLPDEVHEWCNNVVARFMLESIAIESEIHDEFYSIEHLKESRRDFAIAAKDMKHKSAMFLMLDNNDHKLVEYRMNKIKPGHVPFGN